MSEFCPKRNPIQLCFAIHLNYWLQKNKPFIATYIKASGQLLDLLCNIDPLAPNSRLFAADTNLMYTNIDTDHALKVISE